MPEKPTSDTVPIRSASEVLRRPTRDVTVPEDQEVQFSPSNPDMAVHFSRILLRNFDELQLLGFVPRKLAEEKVRHAIEEDDREAYKFASALITARPPGACQCEDRPARSTFAADFRRAYRQVRQAHTPAVARVLSDYYGTQIAFDDPQPRIMTGWVRHVSDRAFFERSILVAALMDITIKRRATMKVEPLLKSLNANNIWIHREGKLRQEGGNLRIWAHNISSYLDFSELVYEEHPHAGWILQGA
jgi:hypothetical protein